MGDWRLRDDVTRQAILHGGTSITNAQIAAASHR
jgi:hypothetical protein